MKKTIGFISLFSLLILAGCTSKNITATATSTNTIPTTTTTSTVTSTGASGITASTVATHNMQSDCRMIISNKVYNITSYFGQHPGGDAKLAQTCGKDGTMLFNTQPNHSSNARNILQNYYVADLTK